MRVLKKIIVWADFILFLGMVLFNCFGPTRLFSVAGRNFTISFYLSIVALPLFYLSYFCFRRHDLDHIIKLILAAFFLLLVSSLGMALILDPIFTPYFTTSPLKTVFTCAVKYAYDLAMIPYFCFFLSYLRKKTAIRCIDIFLVVWILFGLFQWGAYLANNSTLWKIYDAMDVLKIIGGDSTMFARIRHNYGSFRFYGFASEPAENCILICLVFFPYLYYRLFRDPTKKGQKIFYGVCAFFVVLLTALTKSASVFTGLAVLLAAWFFVNLKKMKKSTIAWILGSVAGVLLLVLLIPKTRDIFYNRFLLKLFDRSDSSTQHRYSTIWNDFMIFMKSPLFGVGDDNQGYFYASHVSGTWMANNYETQEAIMGHLGLLSGGAFLPSFISGFGLYGIAVAYFTIRSYFKYASDTNRHMLTLKPFLVATTACMVVLAFATTGIHRNVWFYLFFASPLLGRYARSDLSFSYQLSHPTEAYHHLSTTRYRL